MATLMMNKLTFILLFWTTSILSWSQSSPSLGELKIVRFEETYCHRRDSVLASNPTSIEFWCDTVCTHVAFDFVYFEGTPSLTAVLIADQINFNIIHHLLPEDVNYSTYHDMLMIQENNSHEYTEDTECGATVMSTLPQLFSVSIGYGGYGCGAAHPYFGSEIYNFNSENGMQLQWDDFFDADQQTALTVIAEDAWKDILKGEAWAQDYGEFFLTQDFLFDEGGLHLFYDPYEIAPYAMGAPEIVLSPEQFRPLLRKDCLIKNAYK